MPINFVGYTILPFAPMDGGLSIRSADARSRRTPIWLNFGINWVNFTGRPVDLMKRWRPMIVRRNVRWAVSP